MKKSFAVIAVCLLAVLLCACGSLNANTGKNGGEEQQGMIKTGEISVAEFDMDKHCVTLNSGYIMQKLGLVMEGWYPLGGRGYNKELMKEPVLQKIADSHGVSLVQVILRWNLQKGVVVIPGSANPDHIRENTQLYHFYLSDAEMKTINALDRGEKHDWY